VAPKGTGAQVDAGECTGSSPSTATMTGASPSLPTAPSSRSASAERAEMSSPRTLERQGGPTSPLAGSLDGDAPRAASPVDAGPISPPGETTPAKTSDSEPVQPDCEDRADHQPIRITEEHGPQGFTWTNPETGETEHRPGSGVVSGDGSPEDPFVIEGWCITAPPNPVGSESCLTVVCYSTPHSSLDQAAGLYLADVDAHVVVQDNAVHDALDEGVTADVGVLLKHAGNVTVEKNTVTASDKALFVANSPDTQVLANTLGPSENSEGPAIFIDESDEAYVAGNDVVRSGVTVRSSADVTVQNNTLKDIQDDVASEEIPGVTVRSSANVTIQDNTLKDIQELGIRIQGSPLALVSGNDVTVDEGPGIEIRGSQHATVTDNDLQITDAGFTAGIEAENANQIEVGNNSISGDLYIGLRATSTDRSQIHNNSIDNASLGLSIDTSEYVSVRHNAISEGSGKGIYISSGSLDIEIHDNEVTDRGFTGIVLQDYTAGIFVHNNTIEGNDRHGIVSGTDWAFIYDNRIADNGLTGVNLWWEAENSEVHDNTITGNGNDGVELYNVDGMQIWNNTVTENGQNGVTIWGAHDASVHDNTIVENNETGVLLASDLESPAENSSIEANEIAGNAVGVNVGDPPEPDDSAGSPHQSGTRLGTNNVHANTNGVGVNATDAENEVDARDNWWGCEDGPDASQCDDVVGNASYNPWLTEANPQAGVS